RKSGAPHAPHGPNDLGTAPHERIGEHDRADADEQRKRIGIGASGHARADAVDDRIAANRQGGEQREADSLAIEPSDVAPATKRQHEQAGNKQENPAPANEAKMLADEQAPHTRSTR